MSFVVLPSNMENKHTIYLNMCHHYRKIFSAKSRIDTSPPKVLRKKMPQHRNRGISPIQSRIVNNKSATSTTTSDTIFKKNDVPVICPYYYQHHFKAMEQNYTDDKSLGAPRNRQSQTILKNDVQSKLRQLHIYHPPRKKRAALSNSNFSSKTSQSTNGNEQEKEKLQEHNFAKSDTKATKLSSFSPLENSYSEESSEDSAYNEGECILSSDSRGSTPQISTVKQQLTRRSTGTSPNEKIARKISETGTTKDEILYIQFLKEITSDILKKNIFTNKALRTVFQQHMTLNKYQLDSDKMLKEITKLQERLGVPPDEQFDSEDFGLGKDIPSAEILEEREETVAEVATCAESPEIDSHNKNGNQDVDNKSYSKTEEYEENYSDSFSDISQSDDGKSEKDDNSDGEVEISGSKKLDDDSKSDGGKNYHKNSNNTETDSDFEISEEC